MPIQIHSPVQGGPFGPGFQLDLSTDIVEPLPVDWFWRIHWLYSLEGELGLLHEYALDPANQHRLTTTYFPVSEEVPLSPRSAWLAQTEVNFLARLMEGTGTQVMDEGYITVKADWTSGLASQVSTTTQGGFSEEDRVVLMGVQNNTQRVWADGTTSPLNLLLRMPTLDGLQRWQHIPDLEGEGDIITNETLPSFIPHAIEVEIVSHPPGIGVDTGAVIPLEIAYADLALNWRLADGHFVATDQLKFSQGRILWQPQPWPGSVIHYLITPGCVARFWWVGLRLF